MPIALVTWFDSMKPGGLFKDPDGNGWILRQPPAA